MLKSKGSRNTQHRKNALIARLTKANPALAPVMPIAPFVVWLAEEPPEDDVAVPVVLVPDRTVAVLLVPEDVLEDPLDVVEPDAVPFDDAGEVPEVSAEVAV